MALWPKNNSSDLPHTSIFYDLNWCPRPFNNPTNLLSTRVTQTVYGSVTRFALTTRARQTLLHPSEDSRTSRLWHGADTPTSRGKPLGRKSCSVPTLEIITPKNLTNKCKKPHNNFPKGTSDPHHQPDSRYSMHFPEMSFKNRPPVPACAPIKPLS